MILGVPRHRAFIAILTAHVLTSCGTIPTSVLTGSGGGSYPGDCEGGPREKRLDLSMLPTKDQDGLGICGYESLAGDLSHLMGREVSALCLALSKPDNGKRIRQKGKETKFWFEGDWDPCDAFNANQKHGKIAFASDVPFENLPQDQGSKVVKFLLDYRDRIQGMSEPERQAMRQKIARAMDDAEFACEIEIDSYIRQAMATYYYGMSAEVRESKKTELISVGLRSASPDSPTVSEFAKLFRALPNSSPDPIENMQETLGLPADWADRVRASNGFKPFEGCSSAAKGAAARKALKNMFSACSTSQSIEEGLSDQGFGAVLPVLARMDSGGRSDQEFLLEAMGCNKNPEPFPTGLKCEQILSFSKADLGVKRYWGSGKSVQVEPGDDSKGVTKVPDQDDRLVPKFTLPAQFLRESLDQNRWVNLTLCTDALKNEGPISEILANSKCGILATHPITQQKFQDFNGDHFVGVVGYRVNPKQGGGCRVDYLIRNSWGADCNMYSSRFKPFCDPKTGELWVSQENLEQMSSALGAIRPR